MSDTTFQDKFVDTIICGDNLEVMAVMPDECVDLVVTSPPYNMRTRIRNGQYTEREWTEHFSKKYTHFADNLPIDQFYKTHKAVLVECLRVAPIVLYNIQIVTGSKEAFFRIIGDFGKQIKDVIVWDKGFGQPAMHENVLNRGYELILILESDNKCGRVIQNGTFLRGTLQDIWRIGRGKRIDGSHGACFPVELAIQMIANFSNKGDVVLDPFMGLGTTAIAAIQANRHYIGIDIVPDYCEISSERIRIEQAQLMMDLGGGVDGKE